LDKFSVNKKTNDVPAIIKNYLFLKRIRAISFLLIFIDLKNLLFKIKKKKRIKTVKAVTFLYRVYKDYRGYSCC